MGNRIPDFSNVGYRGGGVTLPDLPVKIVLTPGNDQQDDTARIQTALDEVGSIPPNEAGQRGAVLLRRGHYFVSKTLKIESGGVVLRGEGDHVDGTVLTAKAGSQYTVIAASGERPPQSAEERALLASGRGNAPCIENPGTRRRILDDYVPVGAHELKVDSTEGLSVGDDVVVVRKANSVWISAIGMDQIPSRPGSPKSTKQWKASEYNIGYQRVITDLGNGTIGIDAPIVCAIEQKWGGGEIYRFIDFRISEVGVENLRIVAEFDRSITKDTPGGERYYAAENQASCAVSFSAVKNGWARNITSVHTQTCVSIGSAKWITVQDSTSLAPVSVLSGERRYSFNINGQQILVQRCVAEDARHGFTFGSRVPGPNVVLDVMTVRNYGSSEPHQRWSTGGLYDNFNGNLAIQDRAWMGSGHGWTGANYVVWNSRGVLVVQSPPTAQNWAIGHVGERGKGTHSPRPEGIWVSLGNHVAPRSLYLAQLQARLGTDAVRNVSTAEQRAGRLDAELLSRTNKIPVRPPQERSGGARGR